MIDGFLLGISNTIGCITICAPVIFTLILASGKKPLFPILKFLAGRLIAYIFFAVFAGYIGIYFEGKINPDIYYSLTIVLALWLILYSLGKLQFKNPVCDLFTRNISENNLPFFSGLVLGINPCPPFLMGLNEVLKYGDVLRSLIFFAGFYAGSSIWTFVLLFTGTIQNKKIFILAGKILGILVGLYYLWKGIGGFF